MNAHLLFPILFGLAIIFWAGLHKLINKFLDSRERKHADHHGR